MPPIVQGLEPQAHARILQKLGVVPDSAAQAKRQSELTREFGLNALAEHPPLRNTAHGQDILLSVAVDEPDNGMDQSLPDSADPAGDRRTMGGTTGPTSQGFRHMYFGGWKQEHLIRSFQIPRRAMGQAPARVALFAQKARQALAAGDTFWGYRLLAWSIHYLQDLAQPFHSTQIPQLTMVPWGALKGGFPSLIRATTHSIANYHWALEKYAEYRLADRGSSPFRSCLENPLPVLKERGIAMPAGATFEQLALSVAHSSFLRASELGEAELDLFEEDLRKPEYDLPTHPESLDYANYALRVDRADARARLEGEICGLLALTSQGTRVLIETVLKN